MDSMKKGSIEIQFNWVFVFIVGTIILLFFARVTWKQKDISESKIAIAVLNDIDTITTGAASSAGTAQDVEIPEVDLRFTTTEDCYSTYKLGRNNRRLENTFIFAPDRIEGRSLISWTKDWSIPFKVNNLVYMTSPLVRYVIIDDGAGGYAEQLNRTLNDEAEVIQIERISSSDISSLEDLNNYKVRFIAFDDSEIPINVPEFRRMDDKDVTAVVISPMGLEEYGRVKFYKKNGNSIQSLVGESFYIKEEGMYGAIFADNPDIYNCNMKAAFERLRFVSQLYLNRTTLLQKEHAAADVACKQYYYSAVMGPTPKISMIRDLAATFSITFPPSGGISDIQRLYNLGYFEDTVADANDEDGVKILNDKVLYSSCPAIY
jgi:hypothetical protein